MAFDVSALPGLYAGDRNRVALAMARQAAVWEGRRPDRWPILLGGALTEQQRTIPDPDYKQAFDDVDLMVCSQVRQACAALNSRSDAVPSVRGNYGTGTTLSLIGLEQDIFPDKMPWLKRHLSAEQAAALRLEDVRIQGAFARGLGFMRRHREIMGDDPPLYCMDVQGPLDLAHLILGDDFFYAVCDDPPMVHRLLNFCVALSIKAYTWMKEITGERHGVHYHTNALYAENMGIRICEDSTALLGPEAIREFAVPYTRRLAQHFGGAWVHYCGRNDALTQAACSIPEVRGVNFGHIPGHDHDHVFEEDMRMFAETGKVCFGAWPRRPGESGRDFLVRLHGWARLGCMIPQADAALGDGGFARVGEVLDCWYGL